MTRLVCIELPHVYGDVGGQLARLDQALVQTQPGDVVALPELCFTGYVSGRGDFDMRGFAEPLTGPLIRAAQVRAKRHQVHLVAPFVEQDGGRVYNSVVAIDPAGTHIAHYRKRHPWIPETWASPGQNQHPLFAIDGHIFSIAICYDVHFLRDEAAAVLSAADVLIFPSAWCEMEGDMRDELLPALSTDYDLCIMNANWGVGEPRIPSQGGSRVVGGDDFQIIVI